MRTLRINRTRPEPKKIRLAADVIRAGGVVVLPTETVYGIAASPFERKAVDRIFRMKGRSGKKPLALIVSDTDQARTIAKRPGPRFRRLAEKYWPGPLTVIVRKSRAIPAYVTRGSRNIGIRMPDNRIALALIRECGMPLVATSANISGMPPALSAAEARKQLKGMDMLIDGGRTRIRKASTVLDLCGRKPRVLRQGNLKVRI